ncbi:hypothetical protein GTPT_0777 [Tatumella ptyseos ATCC 33301]|uniref:Uncharacterized protein n=1 Tax=Tatumella ptyseos ATCC 33301 TaxID=1005995 RepID=A0A085JMI2_9GAMM|nr:hypothetical protein GTPT_0777 [Tatumella ptyseos ATCC 33301]
MSDASRSRAGQIREIRLFYRPDGCFLVKRMADNEKAVDDDQGQQ